MSLFQNTDAQDARHTVVSRFFHLLLANLTDYLKANLLCACLLLPSVVAALLTLFVSRSVPLVFGAALLCCPLAGKGLCGLSNVVNRSIRKSDESLRGAFCAGAAEPAAKAALPGALYILSLELTAYMLIFRDVISASRIAGRMWVLLFLLVAFVRIVLMYLLPVMSAVEISGRHGLKNSLMLLAAFPKATVMGMLLSGAVYLLEIFFFPVSLPYILLAGFALHALMTQLLAWPCIDASLHVETRARQAAHAGETE